MQPAMLRRESTAISAIAIFFIMALRLDGPDHKCGTARPLVQKSHTAVSIRPLLSGCDNQRRGFATIGWKFPEKPIGSLYVEHRDRFTTTLQICRTRLNPAARLEKANSGCQIFVAIYRRSRQMAAENPNHPSGLPQLFNASTPAYDEKPSGATGIARRFVGQARIGVSPRQPVDL